MFDIKYRYQLDDSIKIHFRARRNGDTVVGVIAEVDHTVYDSNNEFLD